MKKERTVTRRHRSDHEAAKLEDDEQCETVFIDNLPNEEGAIREMLTQCKKNIALLEKKFFEENDSEVEETSEDMRLKETEKGTNIKQFWCIPLSEDIRELGLFERLARA